MSLILKAIAQEQEREKMPANVANGNRSAKRVWRREQEKKARDFDWRQQLRKEAAIMATSDLKELLARFEGSVNKLRTRGEAILSQRASGEERSEAQHRETQESLHRSLTKLSADI